MLNVLPNFIVPGVISMDKIVTGIVSGNIFLFTSPVQYRKTAVRYTHHTADQCGTRKGTSVTNTCMYLKNMVLNQCTEWHRCENKIWCQLISRYRRICERISWVTEIMSWRSMNERQGFRTTNLSLSHASPLPLLLTTS